MSFWLFKSDPDTYSWHHLLKDKSAVWDGVSNPLALKHLKNLKKGDQILIYHTGDEKAIVGVAQAMSDSYPDPKNSKLTVVDIKPLTPLKEPITLSFIKSKPKFKDWELVRMSRLSVMPVSAELWKELV